MFPVFPLPRALLLPGGRLPLNVFEPRYLNMVETALAHGRMFGMVQPRSRDAAGEAPPVANLQRVGCLGRVSSFAETDDGCFLITLTGLARFDVLDELPLENGYRRVHAGFERFGRDLLPGPAFSVDRDKLLDALRRYFRTRDLDANWDAVGAMDDATLVTTLCMVCPFGEREKQALLEAPDLATRARDLQSLLLIGLHETDGGDGRRAS